MKNNWTKLCEVCQSIPFSFQFLLPTDPKYTSDTSKAFPVLHSRDNGFEDLNASWLVFSLAWLPFSCKDQIDNWRAWGWCFDDHWHLSGFPIRWKLNQRRMRVRVSSVKGYADVKVKQNRSNRTGLICSFESGLALFALSYYQLTIAVECSRLILARFGLLSMIWLFRLLNHPHRPVEFRALRYS